MARARRGRGSLGYTPYGIPARAHRGIPRFSPLPSESDAPAFPTTRWSQLLSDRARDRAAAQQAFETLARRYWRPIVAYVQARGIRSEEEALDATQEFFLWMLETGFLERADPERGRFRGFVKRSLANFLHDLERKRRTVKRGGQRTFLPLDEEERPLDLPDPAARQPEDALDDLWRQELLSQAARALEDELRGRGKDRAFEVFRDYFLSDEELDYGQVAARHGIDKVDVSNALSWVKRRYRAHLRAAVLDTVGNDAELLAELDWLFGGREAP